MSEEGALFGGFPPVGKATALPNLFFSVVAPRLSSPVDVLAFMWAARAVQDQRGDVRFTTANEILSCEGARAVFDRIGGGRDGLECGLENCLRAGALLALDLAGQAGVERVYFVNNPGSRRAVARARAGELVLRPATTVVPISTETRPGIFRLYEENIGTITPIVGERLLEAAELYPWEWIAEAFKDACELNRRNWRYIETILRRWELEGR